MNVLLHKKLLPFLLLIALLCNSGLSWAQQSPTLQVHDVVMLKNDTLDFSFLQYHVFAWPQIEKFPAQGLAYFSPRTGSISMGFGVAGLNRENHLRYAPPANFIGRDTIEVLYHVEGIGGASQTAYKIFNILVLPSQLTAVNDYISTAENQSINIDVLANDFGNGTNLTVSKITNVNNGSAINNGSDITFVPSNGFSGIAHLNYTICDAEGSCDMATVSITVEAATPATYDSIFVTTEKNAEQVILMELDTNYTILTAPLHGTINTFETLTYTPNTGFTGYDKAIFEHQSNGNIRVFDIRVLDVPDDNFFLVDDVVFTPKDEMIGEIHLLDNDNGGSYLMNIGANNMGNGPGVTAEGGHIVYIPSAGTGVFSYEPPTGFTGVDYFTYHASDPSGDSTETATCYIVVSDLMPEATVYDLVTSKNTPLVLGDHLPFLSYEYQLTNSSPNLGSIQYFAGHTTYSSQYGQVVSGDNMLIYEPNPGVTGDDVIDLEYCTGANSSRCQLVKLNIKIEDTPNPSGSAMCAGRQCVWSGDADHNGKVDIKDLLPIGLCMGEVGTGRPAASIEWYAQQGDNWNSLFDNGLGFDVKHIDTDGNGIVSAMDTAAIGQFYGKYNNIVPAAPAPISELPFYLGGFPGNIQPGDVIYVPIHLGNDSIPAFDAYGLTFSIDYDPVIFESVNVIWDNAAWMHYNSPVLSMQHQPFAGKLDAGYTRTSGLAASGYGIIGAVEFIVIEDLEGGRPSSSTSTVSFTSGLMAGSGQSYSLRDKQITFSLNLNGEQENGTSIKATDNLKVFPNPGSSIVNVHLNGKGNMMERIVLYNMVGSQVYDSGAILAKRREVSVSGLAPGVYVMRVWDNDGEVMNKKVEVIAP